MLELCCASVVMLIEIMPEMFLFKYISCKRYKHGMNSQSLNLTDLKFQKLSQLYFLVGPTQTPIQWVSGALSLGVR
jgi:hypothetical protein